MLFSGYLQNLNEVEVDGQEQGSGEQSTDYTADTNPTVPKENGEENNDSANPQQDDNQGQEEQQPEGGAEDEPTDYTSMGEDDEGGDNEGGGDTTPVASDEESPVDDLKKQEEEIYANLTPQQLDIKHKELKNQYLAMFDTVNSIIERIGDTSTSEENIPVVEYASEKMADLQKMLTDYMNDVYKTKSYIENSINYNRFIAVLNGINKILEEMNKKDAE